MLNAILWENPILVKHARARLRRQHLLPWIAIVVILAGCIAWSGLAHAVPAETPEEVMEARYWALIWLLVLQGAILFLIGTSQVASSIMVARETGLIDFHRVSPQHPAVMSLGFILGAPIREVVLFACTLPFPLLILIVEARLELVVGLLLVWLVMLVAALFYWTAAFFAGLLLPRGRGVGALMIFLLIGLHLFWAASPFTRYLTVTPAIQEHLGQARYLFSDMEPQALFFGAAIPAVLLCLLHLLPLLGIFFLAAARKMAHERAFAFTRTLALVTYVVLAVLVIGDAVTPGTGYDMHGDSQQFTVTSILFSLLGFGLLFVSAVTPGAADYLKGVRHARKLGWPRPSFWADTAANWLPVLAFTAVLLLSGVAVGWLMGIGAANLFEASAMSALFTAAACAAGTLAFFGLARQAFGFLFRKNGALYIGLLLFLLWALPLIITVVAQMTNAGEDAVNVLLAISPLSGIVQLLLAPRTAMGITPVVIGCELAAAVVLYLLGLRAIARQTC